MKPSDWPEVPACREVCEVHRFIVEQLRVVHESSLAALSLKKAIGDLSNSMLELHQEIVAMRGPVTKRESKAWFRAKNVLFVVACVSVVSLCAFWVMLVLHGGVHVQIH